VLPAFRATAVCTVGSDRSSVPPTPSGCWRWSVTSDPDPAATAVLGMTLTVSVRPTSPAGHRMFTPGVPR